MGQQLCRLLQPEILPLVLGVCLFGLDARPRAHGLAECDLHGQEL